MKNSLLKNGLYNFIAGLIRIGLGILIIPLLIRLLGIEEYGLWTLASAVVVMVTLAEAGLSTATTVFMSQALGKKDVNGKEDVDDLSHTLTITFGAILILAAFAGVALWVGAQGIISLFPKLDDSQQLQLIQTIQIGGLVVAARLLQQTLVGIEQAYQRYDLMNGLNTIYIVLLSVGMLAVAMLGGHTLELMQWQATISCVSLISHVWIVRSLLQGTNWSLKWNQQKAMEVGGYSLMMWLNTLGSTLFSRGDRLIVGSLLGSQMLGVYAAITDVTAQINSFSALPIQPLLPSLSNLIGQQNVDRRQLKQQVKQATQINGVVALGMGASLITLAPLIVSIFFGKQTTSEHITLFCIATAIYAVYSCHAVGYYSLLATKAVTACALIQLLGSLSSLLFIAFGAYYFGLIGAILGNSGYLITFLVTVIGMKCLSIQAFYWFNWLLFPLSWFCIILVANFILPIGHVTQLLLFFVQSIIILTWFFYTNKNSFNFIVKKLAFSKK